MGHERDLDLLRDIIAAVSQLALAITKPINELAYDLNAAAFSETTSIADDFILDNVEINFSTTAIRAITITSADGTKLLHDPDNIEKSFVWSAVDMGFSGGENITIDITQTGAVCLADVILRVRSGSNTLVGNPDVRVVDSVGNVYEDAIRSNCMPVLDIDHYFTHAGASFQNSDTDTVASESFKDFLMITPAEEVHLINFHFTSSLANAEIVLYEEPTTSNNGDILTLFNKKRASAKTADTLLYEDPTVDVVGTQIEHDLIVGGKQSGGSSFSETGEEWVLKVSTKYLVRYNNKANQGDLMDWKIGVLEPAQL